MHDDLKIIVTASENVEITMPLARYVELKENGQQPWEPSLVWAGFQLEAYGKDWLAETVYPGQLNLLILQLEAALERLEADQEAILHFGEYGGEGGSYVLISPQDDQMILSVIFILDFEYDSILPIEGVIGEPQRLYSYVKEKKDTLLPPEKVVENMYFKHLKMSRAAITEAIRRETQLGRRLFEFMGIKLDNRLFM